MKRGEIWLASLDPIRGSEQAGDRPVVIIQPDPLNGFLRTVIAIPCTTNLKWAHFPFCASLEAGEGNLSKESVALAHQVRVLDKSRLVQRLGQLSDATLNRVEVALRMAQGL